MPINVVSYNVSKSLDIFNEIESYMSQKNNTVLLIQESPIRDQSTLDARAIGKSYKAFANDKGNVVTLVSENLINSRIGPITPCESESRYQILASQFGSIVNVHMPPRSTNRGRDLDYAEVVREIKSKLNGSSIIGGDFNDNPFDNNLIYPKVWYAKRIKSEAPHHNKLNSLMNPFWNLLRIKRGKKAVGTIKANHKEPMQFAIFDQILINHEFYKNILSFGVIRKLGNKTIDDINKNSTGIVGEPHWPVYLSLNFGVL